MHIPKRGSVMEWAILATDHGVERTEWCETEREAMSRAIDLEHDGTEIIFVLRLHAQGGTYVR